MSHNVRCHRCGLSLSHLSLPLTRRDHCPGCGTELHVCRLCLSFDLNAPGQCTEDDAEDVKEKDLANFCEWFAPSETAFNPEEKTEADRALESLEALFSGLNSKGSD